MCTNPLIRPHTIFLDLSMYTASLTNIIPANTLLIISYILTGECCIHNIRTYDRESLIPFFTVVDTF